MNGAAPFKVVRGDGAILDGSACGHGPAVVLSHCWTGSRASWSPVAERLVERGHRVVVYDQRGHGASTLGAGGRLTIADLGDDLAAVLTHTDTSDAVVAGHSMGGMAVLSFLLDHAGLASARLRAAVVASTGAGAARRSLALAGGRTLTSPRIDRLLGGRAGPLLLWRNVGRRPRGAHLRAARDAYLATPPDVRVVFYRAMRNLALTDRLGSVAVPTTVVVGTRDRLTRPRLSRLIASGIPGARLVEAPGAGHLLPYEEPDLLADLISNAREDQ